MSSLKQKQLQSKIDLGQVPPQLGYKIPYYKSHTAENYYIHSKTPKAIPKQYPNRKQQ